ncbi:MAG: hypothetical protein JST58_02280 [Bacteroidetes bacterium]|nr:hypothetical protein [Bacteroidota bacterium]
MIRFLQFLAIKKNYDSLVAALVGFIIIYIYTRHSGIGISPDSVVYLSTAKSLHEKGIPLDYSNQYMVIFPLFYPAFLSFMMSILFMDAISFAPILNACIFAILIYTCGWMIQSFNLRFRWYKPILLSCLVVSPCLIEIYSMVWSETIFMMLLLFFIIALSCYLQQSSWKNLIIITVIAALACVTRYIGVAMIACGGIIILFSYANINRKKWAHLLIFALGSTSLLVINLLYNQLHSGTLTGTRLKGSTPLFKNMEYFGMVLCNWLPLPENSHTLALLITLCLLILFSILILKRFIQKDHFNSYENISMVFFVIYACFMILTATVSSYEIFTSRLLSAGFIPLFFGVSALITQSISNNPSLQKHRWVTVMTLLLFTAFQVKQLKNDYENYDGIKDAGIPGYSEDSWTKDSEIVHFLKSNKAIFKPGYTLYSNLDDAMYYFSGLPSIHLPHHVLDAEKQKFISDKKCYLIWFEDDSNANLLNLKESLKLKPMILLQKFDNGSIYVTE